jgi:branched-chain amino acid transport system substrate-binding protein
MRLLKVFILLSFVSLFSGLFSIDVYGSKFQGESENTIKIGFLIPDKNCLAARQGAELAIRDANNLGGLNGKPFQLIVKSMEGPWGTGSKQAVNLIFEENVWAIAGSHDGRNAHLVEQVTTKARVVFISCWASDPTLTQAYIPWYFTCVPTDLQQADAFIEEIYGIRKLTKLVAVSENGYDSKLAIENFLKKSRSAGREDPLILTYDTIKQDFNTLADKIRESDAKGVILFGKPAASIKLIQQLRNRKLNLAVFGTLSVLDEDGISDKDMRFYENLISVSAEDRSKPKDLSFRKEFQRIYGRQPAAVAAYAYDGISVLIKAIRSAGPDRDEIRKALSKIQFDGVTGPIRFDDKGRRTGAVGLMIIKNGVPVMVER